MGVVWRAHDEQLGRDVAVKELRLPDHVGATERQNWIARLDREARAAARLKHPGIITVHDRITGPDGRPWIVMELVDGGSLADLVEAQGALPPQQVADIGRQVAAALAAAHRLGITHRDIKPANILLEEDRVILTDFGIAALEGDATLTATGMIMGTPAFMAPEQIRGCPRRLSPICGRWVRRSTPLWRGTRRSRVRLRVRSWSPSPRRSPRRPCGPGRSALSSTDC
ncbi:serine/threonine-protein kinase [Streptomyces anulatus]